VTAETTTTAVTTAKAATPAPITTFTRLVFLPPSAAGSSNAPAGSGRIAAMGSVGGPAAADSARAGESAGARAGPHNEPRDPGSFPGPSNSGDPFTADTFPVGEPYRVSVSRSRLPGRAVTRHNRIRFAFCFGPAPAGFRERRDDGK
jgi:hypothetical protein